MFMSIKEPTYEEFQNYTDLHCHRLWAEVGENYICPACKRNKFQILRWTARFPNKPHAFKDWVAVLHRHHDHSNEFVSRNSGRFQETVICDQCNSSDGVVKRKLKLPKDFSFSPDEIACFIKATPHGKHKIDFEKAKVIYAEVNI
jgi:hypothetical protein